MALENRECWVCDECGHPWLKVGEVVPLQCASTKCRSRRWNASTGKSEQKYCATLPQERKKEEPRPAGTTQKRLQAKPRAVKRKVKDVAKAESLHSIPESKAVTAPASVQPNWDAAYETMRRSKAK